MFILFDANVWISQFGLRSADGTAVRYFARQRHATIAVPQIVQLEVEEKLAQQLLESRNKIEDGHRKLLTVFGRLQRISVPTEDEIRETVSGIIPDFDVPTRSIPINLDAAHSSLIKILRKIPPSKQKEQFRDGVIWAHCLELLAEGDVYFVTEDKDFYEARDYRRGLATELVAEMEEVSSEHRIFLYNSVAELLTDIRVPIEQGNSELFEIISNTQRDEIEQLMSVHQFTLFGSVEGDANYFATENANRVYFSFDFSHPCRDNSDAGRRDGMLEVRGSGFLDSNTNETEDVQLSSILLRYPDWEPDGRARGNTYVSAHFNAPLVHEIRVPLDQQTANSESS
ncbi:MAG: PIN domain-containing protein [Chloroflexi bacterium]|nr:PIN domain-containing protein [Chloroflexota bacterium]